MRDAETLRKTITGDVVVNLAALHRDNKEYQRTMADGGFSWERTDLIDALKATV